MTWTSDPDVAGRQQPEVRVLHPSGELDIATVDEFDRLLREVPIEADLVVDLAEVTFVDSVTLSRLVRAARLHEAAGTAVVLAGAAGIVQRVLSITQLDVVLRCTATIPEAEALLASRSDHG